MLLKMREIIGWEKGDSILAPGGSISNMSEPTPTPSFPHHLHLLTPVHPRPSPPPPLTPPPPTPPPQSPPPPHPHDLPHLLLPQVRRDHRPPQAVSRAQGAGHEGHPGTAHLLHQQTREQPTFEVNLHCITTLDCTPQSHYSLKGAASTVGLGLDNCREVEVDSRGRMDPLHLRQLIKVTENYTRKY